MICTRCGTQNSKTSKFCRECGKRLIIEGLNVEVEPGEEQSQSLDDTAVSDLLYETLKLYESDKLESAFAKCKTALGMNPQSSSAHSLLSLIYEKKADLQLERGNREDAEDCLRAAIRQIEWVLEANKDSDADREKLEELCAKVDRLNKYPGTKRVSFIQQAFAFVKGLPTPWVAGAGTFMIVFVILAAMLLRGGGKEERLEKNPAPQQVANRDQLPAPYGQQYPTQSGQPQSTPSSLPPAWTYEPPQSRTGSQQSYTPVPQGNNQQAQPAQPSALPSTMPPLTPYPVSKPQSKEQPKQAQPAQAASTPNRKPAESARTAYMRGDYQSAAELYEQAIASGEDTAENHQKLGMCLYNLTKNDAAISHFQRAVQLYMAQKAAGIDVDAAERAIETCKLYIDDLSRR